MPSQSPGANWELRRRASWRALRACLRVPFGVAHAVGACAEVWARCSGKPGIVSREKVAEARCMSLDLRYPPRRRWNSGFVAPTSLDDGLAATLAWYKEAGWLKY